MILDCGLQILDVIKPLLLICTQQIRNRKSKIEHGLTNPDL